MGFFSKSVLVILVALWCFTSSVFTEELNHVTQTPTPAPAPAPYHHGHHHPHPPNHHHPHPHPHPPMSPPAKPPVKPPMSPPTKPPVKAPVYPPTKAPVKPPTKPPVKPVSPPAKHPVKPPVYPPAKAPVKPPVKPPVYPPAKAPVKPPVKPVSPPAKPPVKPVSPPAKPPVKPVTPPAKPPVKPPVYPPAKPPVMPPVYPPKFNRSLIAVRGIVYCKSCKYASSNTVFGATAVQGAVVRLVCKNKKNIISETTTDKNGYFLLLGPKTVTNYGFRGCRVYLVKSKDYKCNKVSKLFGGDVGAELKPEKRPGQSKMVVNKFNYGVFNVGPFAFTPTCPK